MRWLLVLAAVGLAGCYTPANDLGCRVSCDGSQACPSGLACMNGLCRGPNDTCGDSVADGPPAADGSTACVDPCAPASTSLTSASRTLLFYRDCPATWTDARLACEQRCGHLVTITSALEQNELRAQLLLVSGEWWIGATDAAVQMDWKWVTQETFVYENWTSGEPDGNDDSIIADCAKIIPAAAWRDSVCSYQKAYICELEP